MSDANAASLPCSRHETLMPFDETLTPEARALWDAHPVGGADAVLTAARLLIDTHPGLAVSLMKLSEALWLHGNPAAKQPVGILTAASSTGRAWRRR